MYSEDIDRNILKLLNRRIDLKEYFNSEMPMLRLNDNMNSKLSALKLVRFGSMHKEDH